MNFRALLYAWALLAVSAAGAEYFDETQPETTTLFAFDDVAIPHMQNLRVEMRSPTRHAENPVIRRGEAGTPDAMGVQFYGSVIREGGKFRLWYVAYDDDTANKVASSRWRAAYAESTDGVHWVKPMLGLVNYHGSRENNLIRIEPAPLGFVNVKVLAEPNDPDHARRYKISSHVYFQHHTRLGTLAPFASADGLTWKLQIPAKPVRAELREEELALPALHFEPSGGLYRWDGMYYACGQNAMNAPQPYHGRVTRLYRSADFIHWEPSNTLSFVREAQHHLLGPGRSLEGEQCHEGISVWPRGQVLLGLYGRWHGAKEWKDITIDLGFVLSNDGLHFREPAHEWTFLQRGEDGAWDQGGVLQGQGFENIGEQTFIYYGTWDPRARGAARGGVGIALLPRDRFGDLVVEEAGQGPGDYQQPVVTSQCVTAAIPVAGGKLPRFFVNADGLGAEAALRVELLDAQERPLAGMAGEQAALLHESGFQVPVKWGTPAAEKLPERVRLRMTFEGAKRTGIRLSAVYAR